MMQLFFPFGNIKKNWWENLETFMTVCVFCVTSLELTYTDPNRAFREAELFKELFYQVPPGSFHGWVGIRPFSPESQSVVLSNTPHQVFLTR